MSVSIVTIALNAAEDLPLTIESVLQQDYEEIEYVLLDGGSRDNTPSVLARYSDAIDKIVRVEDAGIYSAMNLSLEYCTHEFVLFLNARDTFFHANTISRMMRSRENDPDIFFGNHVYVHGRREYFKKAIDYNISAELLLRGQIDHIWLSQLPGHQATFVRRSLLQRLRFNTDIQICADHDLMMRAHQSGARFQYIDECVSHYVGGGFSAQNPRRLNLEWCSVYRQYSLNPASVDRFFLGETPSPFSLQNALTGVTLGGDFFREGPYPDRGIEKAINWCRPDGLLVRAPTKGSSDAFNIEGFCPFDNQCLLFICGDREIGRLEIGAGWFKRFVKFSDRMLPGKVLEITAAKLGEVSNVDSRVVGYALSSYTFRLIDEPTISLRRGDKVDFCARNQRFTSAILGDGWGQQEETFLWSIEDTASLRLRIAPGVESISLRCRGNPFVEDADLRGIDVFINGQPPVRHLLSIEACEVLIDCGSLIPDELISIGLRSIARTSPPDDPRLLGFCLFSLHVTDD